MTCNIISSYPHYKLMKVVLLSLFHMKKLNTKRLSGVNLAGEAGIPAYLNKESHFGIFFFVAAWFYASIGCRVT